MLVTSMLAILAIMIIIKVAVFTQMIRQANTFRKQTIVSPELLARALFVAVIR